MRAERSYFGIISESKLRAVLWVIILGLLAGISWLVVFRPAQLSQTLANAAKAVTAPLAEKLPFMQLGTITQPTTILFMGTDVVYTDPRSRSADHQALNGNSDTMMLAFLNPEHNTVSVLNIPRDTEAIVGKYGIRKINSANMLGGPELAKETVSSLLGVPIDHYVVMNIQALVQMVNELGGVTVEVPKKMSYMDWTAKLKIDLQPGFHTLTGNQAMGFVRFRHDALGDIGRIQRQQIFLHAAFNRMLEPRSWLHLKALMDIAMKNINTDISNVDIFNTLNFVHSIPRDRIKFVMLPGDFASNGDWIANTDAKDLAMRLLNPDADIPMSRKNISICIVNATSDKTMGGKVSRALSKLGYVTCVGADDTESTSKVTRIIAQNGNVADAKMLQQDLGGVGKVINASIGNLLTAITIVVHDDVNLDAIKLSSEDAPYIPRQSRPQPLVMRPSTPAGSYGSKQDVPMDNVEADSPYMTPDSIPNETPAGNDTVERTAPGNPVPTENTESKDAPTALPGNAPAEDPPSELEHHAIEKPAMPAPPTSTPTDPIPMRPEQP